MHSPIPINLAVEDELSEQMLRTLLEHSGRKFEVAAVYRKGGFNYLKSKLSGFNLAAQGMPYLMLTDLDARPCATDLIEDWFGCEVKEYAARCHHNFLFFIAVREVESWVLADREAFAGFLKIRLDQMPKHPDQEPDPKRLLVDLARKSRNRRIREDIVPKEGSVISTGPDYNGRLREFLIKHWRLEAAESHSPSLARTTRKLRAFEPRFRR